ncbi:UNVERIFIED_CONTAM: hypothetical protein HDU68_011845 [Siphonaria sp. JEL0065]|nr:hypothetical protein HDU68_011845 [Siphonaria sp. JEL0065]
MSSDAAKDKGKAVAQSQPQPERQTTRLYLSKGKKSTKATFHLHGILFMLSPIDEAEHSTDLQLLVSLRTVPEGDKNVMKHMELWADLVDDVVDDVQQFDARGFVNECVAAGLCDALVVAKKPVSRLWTACKASAAFGRVALRLGHKFTVAEMHRIGDEALAAFFGGRWYDVTPVSASLLVAMFDLLDPDNNAFLRLAAEAAEVLGEVLELVNEQPLHVDKPPRLALRLKHHLVTLYDLSYFCFRLIVGASLSLPAVFFLHSHIPVSLQQYQMEHLDVIASQLFCYRCSLAMATCKCPGIDAKSGEDMQFMIQESLLPQPLDSATPRENIDAWASLVSVHIRASRFQAKAFVAQFVDPAQKDLLNHMQSNRKRVETMWKVYRNSPSFSALPARFNHLWSLDQLRKVGDELVESFFTGRWWELNAIGIVFLMNSFETSKMDPKAPESNGLVVIAECIQAITAVIVQNSKKPGYTIVAPSSTQRMKAMTIFQPIMDFE